MNQDLQEAVCFYERAFEPDVDAVAAFDREFRIVSFNAAMESVSAVARAEALGRPLFDLFPRASMSPEAAMLRGTLEGRYGSSHGTFFGAAIEERRRDFDSEFAPLSGPSGVIGGVAVARSRSLPQVHSHRLQADERFRTMANCAPVLLWMSGTDSQCDFFNQTWLDFTGRTMREEVGFGWCEGVHAGDFQRCMDAYMEAFVARTPFEVVYRLRHRSGEFRWVLDTGAPRFQRDEFVGYIGSCVDITDRKVAQDELAGTVERLKSANAQMEQFLYAASHDLREPLRMIASYSALLADRYGAALDDRARRYTEYMVEGASRMRDLINGLLDFAMIKQRSNESFETVDCARAVGRALESLAAIKAESRATVEVHSLPTVHGHPILLGQLFQNLLHNAMKFRSDQPVCVRVRARREGSHWEVSVEDNGVGFELPNPEEAFVMFRRFHSRREFPGSGIGLSTCKEIVEIHRGRIWLESRVGHGTSVHFTLPAMESEP
ncbi:MAG: PAS domain S-box protein [Deltaproteobacteria bacterium]|nr:PAS domain S-box protein [Deltaproteobacteria bacterium]